MNTYWIKLPPRTRALGVFLFTFVLAMLGFSVTGGLEQVDWLFGIYIGGLVTYFLARWGTFAARVALILPGQKLTIYEKFRKNPGRRRRAPAEPAEFIDPDEANEELLPDDRVIGVFHNKEAAAYPLAALGVREVSNEEYGETPIAVSWSPVTYSARAFLAQVGDEGAVTLGAHTHTVFNSPAMPNTDGSTFLQFTGQAVTGPLMGWSLNQIPVITTTWAAWEKAHPDTEVMSTAGGPEADVFENYYANDRNGIHNLSPTDKRLHGKDIVLGLDIEGGIKAYSYPGLIEKPLVEETLGRTPILVLQERSSATAVAFSRTVNGRTLNFKGQNKNPRRRSAESTASGEGERLDYEPWLIEDKQTGSSWRAITGECVAGELQGNRLKMLPAMTGFWFTWSRFYQDASLFGAIGEFEDPHTQR